jgi:hypothetical protein
MKNILFLIVALLVTIISYSQTTTKTNVNKKANQLTVPDSILNTFTYPSLSDAEKMLKEPAHLKDSIWDFEGGAWKFKCKYWANTLKDSVKWIRTEMFYAVEQYKTAVEAKSLFDNFKSENQKTLIVKELKQVGNEAFLVKDVLNNPFILILKNARLYKFKVYNLNRDSASDELLLLVNKIVTAP